MARISVPRLNTESSDRFSPFTSIWFGSNPSAGDVWLGKDRKKGRAHIVENAGTLSITVDDWKYIAPSGGAAKDRNVNIELGNSKEPQLYNLVEDMGERNNLAARYPEKVAELSALLEQVRETADRQ